MSCQGRRATSHPAGATHKKSKMVKQKWRISQPPISWQNATRFISPPRSCHKRLGGSAEFGAVFRAAPVVAGGRIDEFWIREYRAAPERGHCRFTRRRRFVKIAVALGTGIGISGWKVGDVSAAAVGKGAPSAKKPGWDLRLCAYSFNALTFCSPLTQNGIHSVSWRLASKRNGLRSPHRRRHDQLVRRVDERTGHVRSEGPVHAGFRPA